MFDLRTTLVHIASELPVGDPSRRKILAAVRRTARLDGSAFRRGTYFQKFFDEKQLPSKMFDVTDSRGVTHSIPGEVVLEALAQTRGGERAQAEKIIRQIDFKNGDINHFLRHLAKGLAEQYAGVLR